MCAAAAGGEVGAELVFEEGGIGMLIFTGTEIVLEDPGLSDASPFGA